jgi:hypothetical protein
MLRKIVPVLLFALLLGSPALADFASIAYSPSTGEYGYSHGWATRQQADATALSNCPAADARIVVWVENGWAALAKDSNGEWSTGWSLNSRAEAEDIAIESIYPARILVWVRS